MKTLLCFSGGYDSTALLLHQLHNGYHVDTCYFKLPNNSESQSIELNNRKKILNHVSNITHNHSIKGTLGHDYVYDLFIPFNSTLYLYIQQAYLWIQFLILKVDLSKYDNIIFGYVKYDDFWHYSHEIKDLYNSSLKLTTHIKHANLKYPFEWMTKSDISKWYNTSKYYNDNVKKYVDKIEKLVYYCETPIKKKPCGKCPSCVRHNNEIGKKN